MLATPKVGSGKSTLVKFIISTLGVDQDEVAYIAYTGRASLVLQQKGCPNAQTAHKLLYKTRKDKKTGKFYHQKLRPLEKDYKIIIVDEVSMLPKDMWDLLLSHHIYVLALGDKGQLPPINKEQDNHVLDNPHIFLDEIMRQALDNEIIEYSMKIRNYERLPHLDGKDLKIFNKSELSKGMLLWADQILCATNNTRHQINALVRHYLGFEESIPGEGDKVVCTNNYWDYVNDKDEPLINGCIGHIRNLSKKQYDIKTGMYYIECDFYPESSPEYPYKDIRINYNLLINKELPMPESYYSKIDFDLLPLNFEFGHCITVWKAQGSSWKNILVLEEKFPWNKEEHCQYLYTAITRAEQKGVLIRNG